MVKSGGGEINKLSMRSFVPICSTEAFGSVRSESLSDEGRMIRLSILPPRRDSRTADGAWQQLQMSDRGLQERHAVFPFVLDVLMERSTTYVISATTDRAAA
jgi:hypothetical protein